VPVAQWIERLPTEQDVGGSNPSRHETAPLPSVQEAVRRVIAFLYRNSQESEKIELKTWEKRDRNAEIYRRYLAGEDSIVLSHAYGISDRRIRDIIEHERKRGSQ
jgi:hypothetical protein